MLTAKPDKEIRAEVLRLRKAGLSYREIGEKVGKSHERVRQLLAGHDLRLEKRYVKNH